MHLIPESWSHLHMLVSVFPVVGLLFVIGFYIASLVTNNEMMKRSCLVLFGLLGLLAIPTYLSGDGSALVMVHDPKVSGARIDAHYGWSLAALVLLALTGIAAWFELWRFRRVGRLSNNALHLVLGLSILTLAFMVVVGELGWDGAAAAGRDDLVAVEVEGGEFASGRMPAAIVGASDSAASSIIVRR